MLPDWSAPVILFVSHRIASARTQRAGPQDGRNLGAHNDDCITTEGQI